MFIIFTRIIISHLIARLKKINKHKTLQCSGTTDTINKDSWKSKTFITHIHSHTTDTRPAVPLDLIFVVGTTCLQDGFVNTTTTSNNAY